MAVALFCKSCFGLFQLILSHRTLLNQPKPADFFTSRTSPVFSYFKIPKILQDSPSHQIFGRMHGILNVGKKDN
jgi:hypothetical protein